MNHYREYRFRVDPPQPGSDILIAFLAEEGFETFETTEDGFLAYLPVSNDEEWLPGDLSFEGFSYTYTIQLIPTTNWNEEWERNFQPVEIGKKLLIRAPFHEPNASYEREIVIMPKMSFGTGHHQTTRMMCAAMLKTSLKNKRVLDMGTGTGVLAILAAQLGSRDIVAIDIDEWSVENAKENFERNNCSFIVSELGGKECLEGKGQFDLILANINRNILADQMSLYSDHLVSNGQLMLSGFFRTDVPELTVLAEKFNLRKVNEQHEQEWAMLVMEKN